MKKVYILIIAVRKIKHIQMLTFKKITFVKTTSFDWRFWKISNKSKVNLGK